MQSKCQSLKDKIQKEWAAFGEVILTILLINFLIKQSIYRDK